MPFSPLITGTPGAFDLVDIRPPEQFSDYHIPGSRNVALADVLSNPGFLTGAVPLILIDKDGSQAMAIGGILSQKTERPIRVLSGGLEAFWSATDRKTRPMTVPGSSRPAIQPRIPQPATSYAAGSAGCSGQTQKRRMLGGHTMKLISKEPMPPTNPYIAGIFLGLTLLASFLILGAGLGASGGLARISAFVEGHAVSGPYAGQRVFRCMGEKSPELLPGLHAARRLYRRSCFGHNVPPDQDRCGTRQGKPFAAAPCFRGFGRRSFRLCQQACRRLHIRPGPYRQRPAAFRQHRVPGLRVCRRICHCLAGKEAME